MGGTKLERRVFILKFRIRYKKKIKEGFDATICQKLGKVVYKFSQKSKLEIETGIKFHLLNAVGLKNQNLIMKIWKY